MNWPEIVAVAAAVVAPWAGIIVVVVIQGHQQHRIAALEEKMDALTGELGWKEDK